MLLYVYIEPFQWQMTPAPQKTREQEKSETAIPLMYSSICLTRRAVCLFVETHFRVPISNVVLDRLLEQCRLAWPPAQHFMGSPSLKRGSTIDTKLNFDIDKQGGLLPCQICLQHLRLTSHGGIASGIISNGERCVVDNDGTIGSRLVLHRIFEKTILYLFIFCIS